MFGRPTRAEYDALLTANEDMRERLDDLVHVVSEPNEWVLTVMRKRIIVHTKASDTIDGSLVATMDDGIVLRAARILNSGTAPTSMAGEVFIPKANVAFAQLDESE